MAIVTVEKTTYKVDSLYQWDLNQTLEIYGLSLASIPEVHFCHIDMSRAIVRQSTMDAAGVIRVDVPNSLLQKPYKLQAYICIYEGSTFKTLYKFEIPVNPRSKPADYTLEDDSEVYSFNALENQIVNVLSKYDEVDAKHQEAISLLNQAAQTYDTGTADMEATAAALTEQFNTVTEDLTEQANETAERAANAEEAAQAVQDVVADQSIVKYVDDVLQTLDGDLVGYARVATGTYEGTGTTGSSNPNSLTFDFEPKLLWVTYSAGYSDYTATYLCPAGEGGYSSGLMNGFFVMNGATQAWIYGTTPANTSYKDYIKFTWENNTVSWYSTYGSTGGIAIQLNNSGWTYNYIAIG